MANEIVMTKEGYDDLVKELNELKTTRRAEISEKIRVARGFGDLSENSEYDEAKNEQAIVEARILTLENQLKNVKIIEKSDTVKGTVSLGSFVTIRDVEFGDEMTYRIISSVESSNDMSTITDESPVGKALLGHKAGETVEVTIPSGAQIEYQIIKVE
ncbi:MAG TPA: transcription elongation factor GreA [Candidatus Negativibacillus faecipullorum]|nr:transcription elongation factor GreA [Candidatus Negativibacillus faecipullorum]